MLVPTQLRPWYAVAIPVFHRTRKGSLMDTSSSDRLTDASGSTPSRRDFLHQTAGIATGIATMTTSIQAS